MIYAVKHNKVSRETRHTHNYEDALTASIFERLLYLPQEMLQHVFETAVYDTIPGFNLHEIKHIEYWPNWSAEHTSNKNKIEPDVFIRTPTQDIIIEAKRYDAKQQDRGQWQREIQAYYNEYAEDKKELVFIALGGLHTKATETLTAMGKKHPIYKCTWKAILTTIQNMLNEMALVGNQSTKQPALIRILKDIIMCFELFGFSTTPWLEHFMLAPKIKQESITYLSKTWTN